jgi:hypothetical protein
LKFLKRTRFAAVSGFKKEVDWLHSSALEILILDEFSQRKISPQNLERAHKKLLKLARTLVRSMEFGLFTRSSL